MMSSQFDFEFSINIRIRSFLFSSIYQNAIVIGIEMKGNQNQAEMWISIKKLISTHCIPWLKQQFFRRLGGMTTCLFVEVIKNTQPFERIMLRIILKIILRIILTPILTTFSSTISYNRGHLGWSRFILLQLESKVRGQRWLQWLGQDGLAEHLERILQPKILWSEK